MRRLEVELAELEVGLGFIERFVGALGLVERFLARGLEVSLRGFEGCAALALGGELGVEGEGCGVHFRSAAKPVCTYATAVAKKNAGATA